FPTRRSSDLIKQLQRPVLGFGQHHLACFIKQVVNGLPLHTGPFGSDDPRSHLPPMVFSGIMKIIPSVQTGEAPVKAGLVGMVSRTELGQLAAAIRRDDGVDIRPEIYTRVLGQYGVVLIPMENTVGPRRIVLLYMEKAGV